MTNSEARKRAQQRIADGQADQARQGPFGPRPRFTCPVHNIPDCSPLLNGCSLPIQFTRAYEAGIVEGRAQESAAVRERLLAMIERVHNA